MYKRVFFYLGIILVFSLVSCKNEKNSDLNKINVDTSDQQIDVNKAKEIIYMLPNPTETALIIKNSRNTFTDEYLCPYQYVDRYNTSVEEALALGIYSTDLSFLTMYGENQKAVEYVSAVKKLSERLGIIKVINDSLITQLQQNIENKDKVVSIISETYSDMRAFLEENHREVLAAYMITAAWVEGLYLSVNLVDNVKTDTTLIPIIVDQRYSLDNLIDLLKVYQKDENVKLKIQELKELKDIYDKVKLPMKEEVFDALKTKISLIRNSYINEL